MKSLPRAFRAGTSSTAISPTRSELDRYAKGFKNEPLFPEGEAAPLMAKALATATEGRVVLLITADLLLTPLWMGDAIRGRLSERCGIPREAIAVCTSQTHSSPYTSIMDPDQPWNRRLMDEMVKIGSEAVANLQPAKIGVTKGYNHSIVYNTRLPIDDDLLSSVCPDLPRHRGGCMFPREHHLGRSGGQPTDHEVGVIRVDHANGRPMAVLFHYNCHPATVIEGPSMHGDFSGFAATEIERQCKGVTALFLQGSLADAHPRYFFTNVENARRNGLALAAEVMRVLPDVSATSDVRMDFSSEPFALNFVPYGPDRLARLLRYYREFLSNLEARPDSSWLGAGPDTINLPPKFPSVARRNMVTPLISYCEQKLKEIAQGKATAMAPIECELQVFVWNDLALCLHNWEMFCETGLEIKRLSPARYTFPVGNSNSLVGYVAPPRQFAMGGYEVVTNPMYGNRPGMYDPENPQRIVARFVALLGAKCLVPMSTLPIAED